MNNLQFYTSDTKCVCGLIKCDFRVEHFMEVLNFHLNSILNDSDFDKICPICTGPKPAHELRFILCWPCHFVMTEHGILIELKQDRKVLVEFIQEQRGIKQ